MDLKTAIQMIADNYSVPEDQTADPGEVAWEVRGALTPQEIDAWPLKDPDMVEAYRLVLTADSDEITKALA
jgi:hypothetical protein